MTERGLTFSHGSVSDTKATIISIVPFAISEQKPGLIPGQFDIAASVNEYPECKVIGDSYFYVYIDYDRGSLRVPAPSQNVARSVCYDYLSAQLEANNECFPGLFWKPGIWTPERVINEAAEDLKYYKMCQFNWFTALVERADDDWEKTRVHYTISDTQRYALRAIDPTNSRNRPWVMAEMREEPVPTQICPACGSDVPKSVVICRYCRHVLDATRYNQMHFATGTTNLVDEVLRKQ